MWAADEAISRGSPMRLVYAIDQIDNGLHPGAATERIAAADIAVRHAFTAVEAANKPVKIEADIAQDCAVAALVRASRSAALVCVGAIGLRHSQPGRVGSTAATVAAQAHCPAAVIRHHDASTWRDRGSIVVVLDDSPDDGVLLQTAAEEAMLRRAPVDAVACWQSRFTDGHAGQAVEEGNRRLRAELDRRLARWTRRYPKLELNSVAVHGCLVDYLARNPESIQLVVVSAHDGRDVKELLGPAGNAALHHSDCSVLIVGRTHL